MDERCDVCGARWRDDELKCHECGARRRTTIMPRDTPAGAPLPNAAASLATGSVPQARANRSSSALFPVAASVSSDAIPQVRTNSTSSAVFPVAPAPASPSASSSLPAGAVVTKRKGPLRASEPAAPRAPEAAEPGPPASVPQAIPGDHTIFLLATRGNRVRRLLLVLLGTAVLAIGAVIAYFVLRPEPTPEREADDQTPISISARGLAPPGCADLNALAGSWVFTTVTTNARNEARVGMRGFFEMEVEVQDCAARAHVTKVGRKGRPVFQEQRRPRATAALTPGEGLYRFGFGARFELKNDEGNGVPLRITFAREGEQLVGTWRQVAPRWESSGMYGVLVGERDGDPRKLRVRRRDQPCAIRCAAPIDIAQVDEPDPETIEACRASCG